MFRSALRAAAPAARVSAPRRALSAAVFNPAADKQLGYYLIAGSVVFGSWAIVYSKGDDNQPFLGPTDVLNKPGTGEGDDDDE